MTESDLERELEKRGRELMRQLLEAHLEVRGGTQHKLLNRLSRGEKRNAKRMATVAGVYTVAPYERTAEDVLRCLAPQHEPEKPDRPRPESKRVWASLEKEPEELNPRSVP